MYVHIANTYFAWAGNFALKDSQAYYDQDKPLSLAQLKNLFTQADENMYRFMDHFSAQPSQIVEGFKWLGKYIKTDAYSIFTHEFHHKGQAMSMARLLGHTLVDTDVMQF